MMVMVTEGFSRSNDVRWCDKISPELHTTVQSASHPVKYLSPDWSIVSQQPVNCLDCTGAYKFEMNWNRNVIKFCITFVICCIRIWQFLEQLVHQMIVFLLQWIKQEVAWKQLNLWNPHYRNLKLAFNPGFALTQKSVFLTQKFTGLDTKSNNIFNNCVLVHPIWMVPRSILKMSSVNSETPW